MDKKYSSGGGESGGWLLQQGLEDQEISQQGDPQKS